MRARNIKPGLWKDEELAALPIEARYLFPGLWCLADCLGRLEDRPRFIKAEIYPYDDAISAARVHELLQYLHDAEFIRRYEVNRRSYIQVINFERHQNPHKQERDKGSQIPDVPLVEPHQKKTEAVPVKAESVPIKTEAHQDLTESLAMIPDSGFLIPDSLIPENGNTNPGVCAPVVPIRPQTSQRFEEVWRRWPRQMGKDAACRDWIDVVTTDNEADVMACVGRYLASEEVARGVVRNLGTAMSGGTVKTGWLVDCAKDGWSCNWPQAGLVRTKQQSNADLWSNA